MKLFVSGLVLLSGLLLSTTLSFGKPEYSKKESGAKCTVCHTAMGKKDLNDTGKCYKENNHSLAKCDVKK